MNATDIAGWVDYDLAIREAVSYFPDGSLFVEVGAYLGRSAALFGEAIRDSRKDIRYVAVDTCRGSGVENGRDHHADAVSRGGNNFAGELVGNLIRCGVSDHVSVLVADSVQASRLFADESIDFVHLDAAHDYDSVKRDLRAWLPKVKKGGWIGGDDYVPSIWGGVCKAVEELLPGFHPWAHDSWRYIKP